MNALIYLIFLLWAVVCLIFALIKREQDAVAVFMVIVPLMFIGLSCNLNSSQFVADLYAWL